jgi:peptidoglycan/LPS O-acetylase OafA/YrhL
LQKVKQWLAFLGQHSLQVFAYHLVILYFYIPFRWGAWAISDQQKWFALVLFLASLTLPAWLHAHYQARQKAKRAQTKTVTIRPPLTALQCAAAGA